MARVLQKILFQLLPKAVKARHRKKFHYRSYYKRELFWHDIILTAFKWQCLVKEIENQAKELYDSEHPILYTLYFFFPEDAIEGNGVAPVHLDLAENGKILKGSLFWAFGVPALNAQNYDTWDIGTC